MMIEWPPGSGRRAEYSDEERADLMEMVNAAKRAGKVAQAAREVGFIHELKVQLGARLLPEERP